MVVRASLCSKMRDNQTGKPSSNDETLPSERDTSSSVLPGHWEPGVIPDNTGGCGLRGCISGSSDQTMSHPPTLHFLYSQAVTAICPGGGALFL